MPAWGGNCHNYRVPGIQPVAHGGAPPPHENGACKSDARDALSSPSGVQRPPSGRQAYLAAEEDHKRKLLRAIGPRTKGALSVARAVGMLRNRQSSEVAQLLGAMITMPPEHCGCRGVGLCVAGLAWWFESRAVGWQLVCSCQEQMNGGCTGCFSCCAVMQQWGPRVD